MMKSLVSMMMVAASSLPLMAKTMAAPAAHEAVHPAATMLVERYIKALESNDVDAVLACLAGNLSQYIKMNDATHQGIRDDFEANVLSRNSYKIKLKVVGIERATPISPHYVATLNYVMDYDTGRKQEHVEGTWYVTVVVRKPNPAIVAVSETKP